MYSGSFTLCSVLNFILTPPKAGSKFFCENGRKQKNIIEEFYGFVKYLLPIVNKFPRTHKFILGDRISNKVLDIHEMYIEAYYSSKDIKKGVLVKINIMLEQLRYLIRLSFDWHFINHKRYEYIMGLLLELGKKTGAWINSLK